MARPHCYTDPFDFPPDRLEPREGCDWCHLRAVGIRQGTITPHPHRVGRPQLTVTKER